MKLDRLETHDRLEHFKKDQAENIYHGATECMTVNSLSLALQEHSDYIYLFAHPRSDGFKKRLIWQPRLTRPKAQTNSYLFRAKSKSDLIEIIWLLPPRDLWPEYQEGKALEATDVLVSINNFENHRKELERPHKDDLPDETIRKIYKMIAKNIGHKKKSLILL